MEQWRKITLLCEINIANFNPNAILRIKNLESLPEDISEKLMRICKVIDAGYYTSAVKLAKFCSNEPQNFSLQFDPRTVKLLDAIDFSSVHPTYTRDDPIPEKIKHTITIRENIVFGSDFIVFKSNGTQLNINDFDHFLGMKLDVTQSLEGTRNVFTVRAPEDMENGSYYLLKATLMLFSVTLLCESEHQALNSITMTEDRAMWHR